MISRVRHITIACVLLLAAIVAIRIEPRSSHSTPATGLAATAPLSSEVIRAFPILRNAQTVSPGLEAHIIQATGITPGAFTVMRYETTKAGGLWVVAGPTTICIVQVSHGALSCGSIPRATTQGIDLEVGEPAPPHYYVLYGLIPKPVKAVSVEDQSRRARVSVRRNVFSFVGQVAISRVQPAYAELSLARVRPPRSSL